MSDQPYWGILAFWIGCVFGYGLIYWIVSQEYYSRLIRMPGRRRAIEELNLPDMVQWRAELSAAQRSKDKLAQKIQDVLNAYGDIYNDQSHPNG